MITKQDQLKKTKKLKTKPCKYSKCKKDFVPVNRKHICCDWKCGIEYAKEKEAKRKISDNRKAKKEYRDSDKPTLRKDAQKIANRLGKLHNMIRGIERCVTCGSFSSNQMDGGHAYPTSTYSPIRYYTLQIRPQCVKCNRFNGGSPKEFEEYLIRELGTEKVNWLKSHKGKITKKFTAEYLQKYKKVMGRRLRRQEKLLLTIKG